MGLDQIAGGDDGLEEFIGLLIDLDYLVDAGDALGVARQVREQGVDSLTEKQRQVFDKHVIEPYALEACEQCGGNIPWGEMIDAVQEGGLCSHCLHVNGRYD